MSAFYATGRLLWRPATLYLVLLLALVGSLAIIDLPNGPSDVVDAVASRDASPAVTTAFWRFVTVLAASLGIVLSLVVRELQHTAFAWTLPDLTRKLRDGRLMSAAAIVITLAALAGPLIPGSYHFPVFAWSLLCFTLGGVAFDPVLSKLESRAVPALLAVIAFRPAYLQTVIDASPVTFGLVAAAVALILTRREFTPEIVRRRPHIPMAGGLTLSPEHLRRYWRTSSAKEAEWTAGSVRDDLLSWMRAGLYEGYGSRKGGWTMVAIPLVAVSVITGYWTENPGMVVFFPWIFMDGRLQLHSRLLHPVSRAQRARLFFLSSLVESARALAMGAVGIGLLYVFGFPFDKVGAEGGPPGLGWMAVSFAAWAPVSHWSKLRGPYDGTMPGKRAAAHFGMQMLYISLAMGPAVLAVAYFELPPIAFLVGMTLLLLLNHALFWIALRRHFAGADLIVARA